MASTEAGRMARASGRRPTCMRRRSAMCWSISFSSRGLASAARRESVTPLSADTTTNFREESAWRILAMRSYLSELETQLPPNFTTFADSAKIPSPVSQLRIEDAPAGASPERVVRQNEEAQVPADDPDSADCGGHAARADRLSRHDVQEGLWSVRLPPDDYWLPRGRRQLTVLRLSPEGSENAGDFGGINVLRERNRDRLQMTVPNGDASSVRPDDDRTRGNPIGPRAEGLLGFAAHLLLLVLDERHDVRGDVERWDAGIPGPGERLVGGHMDLREVERIGQRLHRQGEARNGAVRVPDHKTTRSKRRLAFDERDVVGVHLGNQEGDVRIHAVGRCVRKNPHPGSSGLRFDIGRDIRRQGAKGGDDLVPAQNLHIR